MSAFIESPRVNRSFAQVELPPLRSFHQSLGEYSRFQLSLSARKMQSMWGENFLVYPTVEVFAGLTFYLLFLKYGFHTPVFVNMVFFGVLLILTFVDLFERILPNVLTLGGSVFGFLVSPFQSGEFFYPFRFLDLPNVMWTHYVDSTIGILVGGGFLWFVAELYFRVRK